ncbi:TIGR01777 family protein [bacterium]|nr:MAG: TIGR01777 family protein [bacterium]
MSEKIVITGGSGFLGTYLTSRLTKLGYDVVIVSRRRKISSNPKITYSNYADLSDVINGSRAVINLAGYNLFDSRWTERVKKEIVESRINTTQSVVRAIHQAENKPDVFISASAVGYYGNRGNDELTENSSVGNDFLADVCQAWENEALKAEDVRVVIPRIGIILEKNGGALGKMLTPFQFFVGGPLGNGEQFFPWIHMQDVVDSIIESIKNESYKGVYNCVAPQQITMNQFSSALGTVLNRPSLFKVPEFALGILLGEASEALVASQRVLPKQLIEWGYSFRFSDVKTALEDILN